ncbi:ROK family protein [Salibaculum griseiflavum]|uniref:N-acetylglucosamine kinase n=1 Tax=Salibaculum griseiflavum TaxID=1914409 RepID=A0A2V1PA98_9RHOB|nr:ROK family protein [Salibaculum griseiflavum]PWG18670.1 hypothetical protein DFK10_01785 [Salibaculum griseiflavum]
MIAAGIDLGGTKSEVQLFDSDWTQVASRRDDTPKDYAALVECVADQVRWALDQAGAPLPVGVGAAGLVDAKGNAFTANLVASGHPFPADIAKASGHAVTYVNDCRALALSEAVFGAGRGHRTVMSLILGTGIGGGVVVDGSLHTGPTGTGGEYGHSPAAAAVVARHGLPIHSCGCGRQGCVETYVAGPGLCRMAKDLCEQAYDPEEIGRHRHNDEEAARVWAVWLEMMGELMLTMVQTVDPDCIVIAGGLSRIEGLVSDLTEALAAAQIKGFDTPPILLAEGGDASGARGAAFAALQEAQSG